MTKLLEFVEKYWWGVLLILLIPSYWALLIPGFYGASDDLHIAWLYELDKTLRLGQIPPRFVPDLSFGFGYPLFNFVFPLPFYLGELFHVLGLSLVDSIKSVFLISLPLSALSMYALLRQFGSRWTSLVGALIYVYTPYRAVDIYIRGAIGEIVSFIFFPLIILAIFKLEGKNYLEWIGIGGLSLAALTLSHDIATYMFFPFLMLLIIIKTIFNKGLLLRSGLMVGLGLLVSSYFWIPALLDSSLMKYSTVFDFADHFPSLKQLIVPYWQYGGSPSFNIGIVNLILVVVGGLLLKLNSHKYTLNRKILLTWGIISFVIVSFMMNSRSTFLWQSLPYLPYFQFPWRFLMMTTFLTPLFIIIFHPLKKGIILVTFLLSGALLLNASHFRPQDFLGRQDSYFLNRYIPIPQASPEYRQTQEEYLRLPKATSIRPNQNFALVSTNPLVPVNFMGNDFNAKLELLTPESTQLNFNKYNFPGWTATLDNQEVALKSGQPFGQVALDIPKGKHTVNIKFDETPFKKALDGLSLVGLLLALFLWTQRILAKS